MWCIVACFAAPAAAEAGLEQLPPLERSSMPLVRPLLQPLQVSLVQLSPARELLV